MHQNYLNKIHYLYVCLLIYNILLTIEFELLTINYICGMRFLKKILDFYIFSNIHVAFAGFCITKITLLKYQVFENYIPFFVASTIVFSYNFIRFYEIKTNKLQWFKKWFEANKVLLFLLFLVSIIGSVFLFFKMNLNVNSIAILSFFSFMTLFYVVPITKVNKKELSFRNFPFIKIYSISIAWAGVSVLFALSVYNIDFSKDVWLEFSQRILILIAITLPFDIRDLDSDPKELKTIPQLLGVLKSKIYGSFLLILFFFLELLKSEKQLISTILIALITLVFLVFSSPKKNRYYTSFWVESIPIFWLIILMYF